VEIIGNAGRNQHRHGCGFQVEIQRLGQAERIPVAGQIGMGDLGCGVDARIGAPGRRDPRPCGKAGI
jgi:hypothetical protein